MVPGLRWEAAVQSKCPHPSSEAAWRILASYLRAVLTWVSADIMNHTSLTKGTGLLAIPLFMYISCLPLFLIGPLLGNMGLTLRHVVLFWSSVYIDKNDLCYLLLVQLDLNTLKISPKTSCLFACVSLHVTFFKNRFCSRQDFRNWVSLKWSITKYHKIFRQPSGNSVGIIYSAFITKSNL